MVAGTIDVDRRSVVLDSVVASRRIDKEISGRLLQIGSVYL